MELGQVLLPVPPAAHELAVVALLLDDEVGDREMHRRLGARLRRQPVIGVRGAVRQAGVDDDQLGAVLLALEDALGVGVEVVPGLEMRGDEVDHLGARVVGARAVDAAPELVAGARRRRADVGMRVVAVDPPGGEHPLGEAVLARAADVVHDLVLAPVADRLRDPPGDVVERLVPGDRFHLPLPRSPSRFRGKRMRSGSWIWLSVAGPLAQFRPREPGCSGLPSNLRISPRLAIDVGEETAGRLAVEAGRRHQPVALLDPLRPRLRVELDPVVPALLRRIGAELRAARARDRRSRRAPRSRASRPEPAPASPAISSGSSDHRMRLLMRAAPTDRPERRRARGRAVRRAPREPPRRDDAGRVRREPRSSERSRAAGPPPARK